MRRLTVKIRQISIFVYFKHIGVKALHSGVRPPLYPSAPGQVPAARSRPARSRGTARTRARALALPRSRPAPAPGPAALTPPSPFPSLSRPQQPPDAAGPAGPRAERSGTMSAARPSDAPETVRGE